MIIKLSDTPFIANEQIKVVKEEDSVKHKWFTVSYIYHRVNIYELVHIISYKIACAPN